MAGGGFGDPAGTGKKYLGELTMFVLICIVALMFLATVAGGQNSGNVSSSVAVGGGHAGVDGAGCNSMVVVSIQNSLVGWRGPPLYNVIVSVTAPETPQGGVYNIRL